MISRRSLLRAAPLLVAAPALVRFSSLMPIRAWAEARSWGDTILFGDERAVVWNAEQISDFIRDVVLPVARRNLLEHQFGSWEGVRFSVLS